MAQSGSRYADLWDWVEAGWQWRDSVPQPNLDGLDPNTKISAEHIFRTVIRSVLNGFTTHRIVLCSDHDVSIQDDLIACFNRNRLTAQPAFIPNDDQNRAVHSNVLAVAEKYKIHEQTMDFISRYGGLPAIIVNLSHKPGRGRSTLMFTNGGNLQDRRLN